MRYTFECLNPPLLLFRTAKSQSLLDKEMGGHVLCMSLVSECAFVWSGKSLSEQGLGPRNPFSQGLQIFLQNKAEYRARHHQLLDMSLQVVTNGQWGFFSWNFVLNLTNLSGFGKLKLYFCGEANSYRKKFSWVWPSWPSYYCYNYIKWDKMCHFNRNVFVRETNFLSPVTETQMQESANQQIWNLYLPKVNVLPLL